MSTGPSVNLDSCKKDEVVSSAEPKLPPVVAEPELPPLSSMNATVRKEFVMTEKRREALDKCNKVRLENARKKREFQLKMEMELKKFDALREEIARKYLEGTEQSQLPATPAPIPVVSMPPKAKAVVPPPAEPEEEIEFEEDPAPEPPKVKKPLKRTARRVASESSSSEESETEVEEPPPKKREKKRAPSPKAKRKDHPKYTNRPQRQESDNDDDWIRIPKPKMTRMTYPMHIPFLPPNRMGFL